jgi:MoaA/NifB/PqqE/SkfB family radical SAM enzyme
VGNEEAQQSKEARLTGMIVSLDHHIHTMHDRFRGYPGAYENAVNAILACHQAELGTALAICVTSEFATEHNVKKYMDLARKLGVHFVQFLEPKPAGRYTGKDVLLSPVKQKLLEDLAKSFNHDAKYRDYPIINYPDSVMRKVGCFSGDRTLYVNSAGQIQQCPFCNNTLGHVLDYTVDEVLKAMQRMPCSEYSSSTQ